MGGQQQVNVTFFYPEIQSLSKIYPDGDLSQGFVNQAGLYDHIISLPITNKILNVKTV